MVVTDGQQLTLGDTTVTLALAPGHTAGTLAIFVGVRHLGARTRSLIFSGTQMPEESLERLFDDYARPLAAETATRGSRTWMRNSWNAVCGGPCWTQSMNTLELMERIRQQYPAGPHPLLLGPERFGRYLSIMLECASARLAAME